MRRGECQLGRESFNPNWRALVRRMFFARGLREFGDLYGNRYVDEQEAASIREECEAVGVPMGYGREPREPIQLDDTQARAQFRVGRNH